MSDDAPKRLEDGHLKAVVYSSDSAIHGRGLFAACDIAPGEYIGTFHGSETDTDGEHVLWVYPDEDAEPVGRIGENLLRFINHADPCNAEFDGFDLYALRAIRRDQEITIHYGDAE